MGLDMYLTKHTYVKNWDHQSPEERHAITIEGPRAATIDVARIKEIVEEVCYWRKANAIHGWFVANVQGGVDECQATYVSREKLRELAETCARVIEKRDPSELPPTPGFFFGSTEVDEWYWKDVEQTRDKLRAILAEPEIGEFYYQSSW